MIRIWPYSEAPSAFREFPGTQQAARGRVPVWLLHCERNGSPGTPGLVRELLAAWAEVPGNEIHPVDAGGAGKMVLGCRSRPETEESRP